ncbi:ATP-dependent metallopeptidase HflB family protein [Bordetella holmesii 44057]|nr:ATP-dependent metallopeptidase HflB family protein [Bordetella holmesii 44057]
MNNSFSKVAVWMVIALVLFTVFKQFDGRAQSQDGVSYTQFMDDAKAGRIRKVDVQGDVLYVTPDTGRAYTLTSPGDLWMVSDLLKYGVQVSGKAREEPSLLMSIFVSWFPMLLLIGVWVFFMRQMQGGGRGGAFSFGKSRARMLDENTNQVTFADVAGCDEAKEDVQELVDFLRDPSKFQKLGGRIPRGVLMVGSPGTGKTLLAKAIAGEAKVPFFSISGSDFVEMFVGVGAARVRDMFENAKKHAPCIIFIDEIDAVGRQRGAGLGGGNDEREQTLNQMLVEMDGFESGQGVIVIAATNRPDVLDPALLRPGRFDRQVVVPLPDIRGREQILKVHMRKVPLSPNVDATILARGTPGFSGADLANLVNEAALFAARRNGRTVDMSDFEKAKDKIIMGAERRSIVMPEEERRNTAYHESGHAIVARMLPKTDPVHKVTIIPRGRALGVTMQLPETDRYSMDKGRLLNTIAVLFGGRIAEELFMDQMTTGASNDFERATAIARDIVTRYGMTDELGPMVYADNEGEVFLGRSVTKTTHVSEATMQKVDNEIRRIIDEQYGIARKILEDNRDKVEVMTRALLDWETIDADQINDIIEGRPPRPPSPPRVRRIRRIRRPVVWRPGAIRPRRCNPRSSLHVFTWQILFCAGALSWISSARLLWVSSMSLPIRFRMGASTTMPMRLSHMPAG